jgi:ABC-type multidrug transport system ATPase subunit
MSAAASSATTTPAIECHEVSRLFRGEPALVGVSLAIEREGVTLLRGPNGAGKSTLLRLCATVIAPTFGRMQVLGHDVRTEVDAIRRRIELLGHRTRLYEDATPIEQLRYVARLHRAPIEDVPFALRAFGLDEIGRRPNRTLSHGQRQRVALARASLRRPDLLLLDEPYGGLDDVSRDAVDALIAGVRAHGATVLIATHDLERARSVVDRVVTMHRGRIAGDEAVAPVAPGAVIA